MNKEGNGEDFEKTKEYLPTVSNQVFKEEQKISKSQSPVNFDEDVPRRKEETDKTIALMANFSGDLQELDKKVRSMMEKTPNATTDGKRNLYVCKVCGKEGQSINVQTHIESNHLEGVSVPCNLCEKICRSRNALSQHMKHHTK